MSSNFNSMEDGFTYYFFLKVSVHPNCVPNIHYRQQDYFGPRDKKVMSKFECYWKCFRVLVLKWGIVGE